MCSFLSPVNFLSMLVSVLQRAAARSQGPCDRDALFKGFSFCLIPVLVEYSVSGSLPISLSAEICANF